MLMQNVKIINAENSLLHPRKNQIYEILQSQSDNTQFFIMHV